jgi:ligand-binding SRPBCC domain-containing protein
VARVFSVSKKIHVNAPIERCFLLSTHVDLVKRSMKLRLVPKKSTRAAGLFEAGDQMMWRGWVYGLPLKHQGRVTKYEQPEYFQNCMEQGRFQRFEYDHFFAEVGGQTLLNDKIRFSLPAGSFLRPIVNFLLVPYMERALQRRLKLLKQVAESDEWKNYLSDES